MKNIPKLIPLIWEVNRVTVNDDKSCELCSQVALGMTPSEAHRAAGAFFFKVIADPAKWKRNTDPYRVMWAQSQQPDDSEIWMTFKNSVQYPSEGEQTFRVYFRQGRAVKIEKLT